MGGSFEDKALFVLNMHNALRRVHAEAGTPQGHFINENTVLRLAAMMEAQTVRAERLKPEGCLSPKATSAEVGVRALFLFRNLIVHSEGRLKLSGARVSQAQREAYRRFCRESGLACQKEGEVLCLDATRVITPLIAACRTYYSERRGNRTRQQS